MASLESKLSELSATVGNYDRQREQDQMAIQSVGSGLLCDQQLCACACVLVHVTVMT